MTIVLNVGSSAIDLLGTLALPASSALSGVSREPFWGLCQPQGVAWFG